MILERYYRPGDRIHIDRAENGKYFVRYSVTWHEQRREFIPVCSAGPFDTLEDARTALRRHRPGAVALNSMCANCHAVCNGTAFHHYTGCVRRETD